jgi:ornithine decarboxylase
MPEMAVDVLEHGQALGLEAYGISFHVGSQQRKVKRGIRALAWRRRVFNGLRQAWHQLSMVNMGGGFPTKYLRTSRRR